MKGRYEHGFEYSDCWVDDARLVILNALDAAERGATIRTRANADCNPGSAATQPKRSFCRVGTSPL